MSESAPYYGSFDHRTASTAEILSVAHGLVGRTLGDISGRGSVSRVSEARTKGDVGAIVEAYFSIPPNTSPLPDFPGAGIELKTVPLFARSREVVVKERTFIAKIDYHALAGEEWTRATVRKKLQKVLFVFYRWAPAVDISAFTVEHVLLWSPDDRTLPFLETDWRTVRDKVRGGQAHLISEGDGRILGAATKSATGADRQRQPFSAELAKPRGWALKPTFVRSIFVESTVPDRQLESLVDAIGANAGTDFERQVLDHFDRYVGKRVGDVAALLGLPSTAAKHRAAIVVRRALGQRQPELRIKEFERLGIEIKIVRLAADARPYEAMSFPAFRYGELVAEQWEDSDLLARLNRLLVVPVEGRTKETSVDQCVIRAPFFWSPSGPELDGIRQEWEMFRAEVAAGLAGSLTPASGTRYIHVRPKARDSTDTDDAPGLGPVVKKCFWLNQRFVQELVLGYAPGWRRQQGR